MHTTARRDDELIMAWSKSHADGSKHTVRAYERIACSKGTMGVLLPRIALIRAHWLLAFTQGINGAILRVEDL